MAAIREASGGSGPPRARRPPRAAGGSEALNAFLGSLVEGGLLSSVVGLVASPERIQWTSAAGLARPVPPLDATARTRFDLASLTKPFVASLALRLDGMGLLPLDLELGEVWPGAHRDLADRSLEDLLRHRAGLPAWTPLYARCRDRQGALRLILSGALAAARPGTYSDLGYLLWGLAAEEKLGEALWPLLRRHLLEPLGLHAVVPSPGEGPGVAACGIDTGREAELAAEQGLAISVLPAPRVGQVQDGNARFLVGDLGNRSRRAVALRAEGRAPGRPPALPGHAGLFGGAQDLWRLAAEWLRPRRLLDRDCVESALAGSGPYALGWARRRSRGSAGPALSTRSLGHTGFTGGSLWMDPEAGRILVLLGHRTSPFSDLQPVRRRFHRLAIGAG